MTVGEWLIPIYDFATISIESFSAKEGWLGDFYAKNVPNSLKIREIDMIYFDNETKENKNIPFAKIILKENADG